MIRIDINISNPWPQFTDTFEPIYNWSKRLTKNKTFEFETYILTDSLFNTLVEFTPRRHDHGGLILSFGLLGFIIACSVRDNRHWNFEIDDWEVYVEGQN